MLLSFGAESGLWSDGHFRTGCEPDLFFRGFYACNSKVGSKTPGVATFYLRVVWMNRNLWGVENSQEINIRYSKFAANRFAEQAAPALGHFADSSPADFVSGIRTARERIIARTEDGRAKDAACSSAHRSMLRASTGRVDCSSTLEIAMEIGDISY